MEDILDTRPTVDLITVADKAEALNGKLYMMGGGWDRLWLGEFPREYQFSIAAAVVIPWMASNMEHRLSIRVTDDSENELAMAQVNFNAGTSAQMKRGESQKILVGLTLAPTFTAPGVFHVKALIDDDPETGRATLFYVNHRPVAP